MSARVGYSRIYGLLLPKYFFQEYSEDRTFNRTLIRRGYCVSARCPSTERNASLRFERCAQQWGHDRALRTSLKTLHYCRSAEANRLGVDTLETSYRVVLYAMYAFLTLNLVGTVYDFMSEGNAQSKLVIILILSLKSMSAWNQKHQ